MTAATARIVLTAGDDGRRVRLRLGQTAQLLVLDLQAPEPEVEGDSIELIEMANVGASGRREWEIRSRMPGTSKIAVSGRHPFTLLIEVPLE